MAISLSGSLNLSGSLTTTGTITATTLVVQTITSSISSITGSTNFGSLAANTHTFTGSMFVSGSNVLIGTPTSNGFRFKVSNNGAEEWALNPGDSPNVNNHVNYNRNTSAYIGANYLAATHSFLNGNVGIGNTSPIALLDLYTGSIGTYFRGGSDNIARQLKISSATTTNAGDTHIIDAQSGTGVLQLSTTSIPRIYIPSNGSSATLGSGGIAKIIGSGTNSGYTELQFYTYNGPTNQPPVSIGIIKTDNGGYENGEFYIATKATNANTAPIERMRITSGGFFKASNFANPTYGLYYHQIFNNIYGDWIIELAQYNTVPYGLLIRYPNAAPRGGGNEMLYLNDSTGNVFKVSSNGNVYNLNNSYNALSDIKLKENITDATPKLDKLMQVRVVNFNLKTDPNIKQIGVIAQELQEVFPGLVEENYDRDSDNKLNGETTLGVKYSVFVPMLIKAIQELTARVQYLENK